MSDHRCLEVWKRSSNSVPNNIAEGANSGSDAKYLNHVHYAIGSANEMLDQLTGLAAVQLQRVCDRDLLGEVEEIGAMLGGLAERLERDLAQRSIPKKKARRKAPRRPIR